MLITLTVVWECSLIMQISQQLTGIRQQGLRLWRTNVDSLPVLIPGVAAHFQHPDLGDKTKGTSDPGPRPSGT